MFLSLHWSRGLTSEMGLALVIKWGCYKGDGHDNDLLQNRSWLHSFNLKHIKQ